MVPTAAPKRPLWGTDRILELLSEVLNEFHTGVIISHRRIELDHIDYLNKK